MGLATIDPHSHIVQTKIYKTPKFGVNRPNRKQDTAIWKCQNLKRNVWLSISGRSRQVPRPPPYEIRQWGCGFCLSTHNKTYFTFLILLQENGETSLHIAVKLRNVEISKMLVQGGAKTETKNVILFICLCLGVAVSFSSSF